MMSLDYFLRIGTQIKNLLLSCYDFNSIPFPIFIYQCMLGFVPNVRIENENEKSIPLSFMCLDCFIKWE